MADPFIGEIRIFAGNFAPRSWAFCDGQLLQIVSYTALFSIFGTTYGGDGQTTFGLPDLKGRAPMHYGNGPGLSNHPLGERTGNEGATIAGLAAHTHKLMASGDPGTSNNPDGRMPAVTPTKAYDSKGNPVPMHGGALPSAGGNPHNNMMPYLTLNFIVALEGLFPSRA